MRNFIEIRTEAAMRNYSDINNTEIVSQIGGSAILPCKASRSSDAAVTWIRRSDFALLTGNLSLIISPHFHRCHYCHKRKFKSI